MADDYACPECGSTDQRQEAGDFGLIAVSGYRLQLDDPPNAPFFSVRIHVCRSCNYVSMHKYP